MILLVGGTGRLGSVLAARLTGRGLAVRVLTRDPARAAHLAVQGAEVAPGDVRDCASLAARTLTSRPVPPARRIISGRLA